MEKKISPERIYLSFEPIIDWVPVTFLQRAWAGKLAPFSRDDGQKDERNRVRSQQVRHDEVLEEGSVGEWGLGEKDESARARVAKTRAVLQKRSSRCFQREALLPLQLRPPLRTGRR